MKKSPQLQKLEEMLHTSKISSCGFMGDDARSLDEIIDSDAAEILKLGKTAGEIASRMRELSEAAKSGLGDWVKVGDDLEVLASDTRGTIPCPWSHGIRLSKAVTTARRVSDRRCVSWSALNIHLIEAHGFFEGRGAPFRQEPGVLVKIIFQD